MQRLGSPHRPVHQAVQGPKVTQWSEGRTGLKKKRQGLGNRAFGNKSEGSLKKKKKLCGKGKHLSISSPEDESGFLQSRMSSVRGRG